MLSTGSEQQGPTGSEHQGQTSISDPDQNLGFTCIFSSSMQEDISMTILLNSFSLLYQLKVKIKLFVTRSINTLNQFRV